MRIEELMEQIEQLRFQLVQVIHENSFNLQHPRVIEVSQHLDTLIVLYHAKPVPELGFSMHKPSI